MTFQNGLTIRMLAAGCQLARQIHEAKALAEHLEPTPWESLAIAERNLLVEVAVDLLLDMSDRPLPEVANERVSYQRRVKVPLQWKARS